MSGSKLILGIDPGSRFTGYALLKKSGNVFTALRCDTLRLDKEAEHPARLARIYSFFSSLISNFSPSSVAIETPVYGKDPTAMLKLGRAQAACMLAAINEGVQVFEYYPKMVKKSITGNGNASKQQVAFMIDKMIRLEEAASNFDASDALAVAWCHAMKGGMEVHSASGNTRAKGNSWSAYVKENQHRIKR